MADKMDGISGNGIGEKNIHFMMEKMNGCCETEKADNAYRVDLRFKIIVDSNTPAEKQGI